MGSIIRASQAPCLLQVVLDLGWWGYAVGYFYSCCRAMVFWMFFFWCICRFETDFCEPLDDHYATSFCWVCIKVNFCDLSNNFCKFDICWFNRFVTPLHWRPYIYMVYIWRKERCEKINCKISVFEVLIWSKTNKKSSRWDSIQSACWTGHFISSRLTWILYYFLYYFPAFVSWPGCI